MENVILILDFGSSFLKGLGFLPSKEGARIVDFYKKRYSFEKVQEMIGELRLLLEHFAKSFSISGAQFVILAGEGIGVGDLKKIKFKREERRRPLGKKEFSRLIHFVQEKSSREVESRFPGEKILLAFSEIENVEIDGWETSSPINLAGEEVTLEVVNFYLPQRILRALKKEFSAAGIKNISLIYFPKVLAKLFSGESGLPTKIFIDVGGKNTQLFETFEDKMQWIRSFPFGGDHFSKRIIDEFGLPPEAQDFVEEVKQKIYQGIFTPYFKRKLEMILKEAYFEWENFALEHFGKKDLPFEIYLLGGGSNLPLFNRFSRTLENFYSFPIIQKNLTNLAFFKKDEEFGISDPQMTNLFLIAQGIAFGKISLPSENFYDLS